MQFEMMWKFCSSLVELLIICLAVGPSRIFSKEEFVPGAVPIREPDNRYPLMYKSVYPLLFNFSVPIWDAQAMKIQFWKQHNNCTKDDLYTSGYPCPIMFHMHPIADEFRMNMTNWLNLFTDTDLNPYKSGEFLWDTSILTDDRICSSLRIEPHFKERLTNSGNIKEYVKILGKCAEKNGTEFNLKIEDMSKIPSYLEKMYHDTFSSFTADYWNKITEAEREAITLIGWTALQVGLMSHQSMEAQKWSQAVETCKNYRVPWTILKADSLKQQLSVLRSYLSSESQDLAIPVEDLQKYFELPLADCIFGEDNTFIVRVMVPTVPKEVDEKNYFVRFHSVPFVSSTGKICSLLDNQETSIPYNIGLKGVLPCTCDKSALFCKAWSSESQQESLSCPHFHQRQERCIRAIASESETDITQSCTLSCKNPPAKFILNDAQLVIHKSDNTLIKITPAKIPKGIQFVRCRKDKMLLPPNSGAYEVTLPANCDIFAAPKNSSALNGTVDQIDLVHVDHLKPYHWQHGEVISEEDDEYHDLSLVDQIDNLHGLQPQISLLTSRLQELDDYCRQTVDPTWIWIFVIFSCIGNILLGIVVGYLYLWKVKQVNDSNRLDLLSNAMDFPVSDE